MIKGRHGVLKAKASLLSLSYLPLLSSICGCACPSAITSLTSIVSHNIHKASVHTSRYIDFQIAKLKQYAQNGTPINSSGIGSLLSKPYITTHQAKELLQLAKSVKCITIQMYNDYLGALSANAEVHVVVDAIQEMDKLGIEPNIRTFNTLLHLVISNASLFPSVVAQIQQKGIAFDVATYNIVMRHYFLVGNAEKSLEIESLMERNGIAPNVVTFNQLLHIWAKKVDPKKCDEVLERMRARNIHPTVASYTILIQLYVNKLQDVETGLKLFKEMKAQGIVPDARPYDTLIEALSARGDYQRSLELFHEMQQGGLTEGTMAYSVLIDKFTKDGKFEEGWLLFNKMKESKEPLRAELWNVFLRYFAQRGDLTQSLVLLQDMNTAGVRPTTQTYNVLLSTEGMTLESKLQLWENMKQIGVERDRFTFNLMIVAFMKANRYADCEATFNEMPLDKVHPDPHLLITMRDVYQRAGQLEKSQAMSAAAKKLVRHNMDLRDLVRKKQQKNQLQKRIEYQKDIQEVESLLAMQHNKIIITQPENTSNLPPTTQHDPNQPDAAQLSPPPTLSEPSEPSEPSKPLEPTEPPNYSDNNNYYSHPYYSQPTHPFQPLYYVPYQTQYNATTPSLPNAPPASQRTTEQQGLPRRRRVFNQAPPPPIYYPPPQPYWPAWPAWPPPFESPASPSYNAQSTPLYPPETTLSSNPPYSTPPEHPQQFSTSNQPNNSSASASTDTQSNSQFLQERKP